MAATTIESEYEIPEDTVVNFFCPHYHTELRGAANCVECGSPMVPMIVKGGGVVQICSKRGCKGHLLDLSGGILYNDFEKITHWLLQTQGLCEEE